MVYVAQKSSSYEAPRRPTGQISKPVILHALEERPDSILPETPGEGVSTLRLKFESA